MANGQPYGCDTINLPSWIHEKERVLCYNTKVPLYITLSWVVVSRVQDGHAPDASPVGSLPVAVGYCWPYPQGLHQWDPSSGHVARNGYVPGRLARSDIGSHYTYCSKGLEVTLWRELREKYWIENITVSEIIHVCEWWESVTKYTRVKFLGLVP